MKLSILAIIMLVLTIAVIVALDGEINRAIRNHPIAEQPCTGH